MGLALYRQHAFDAMWNTHGAAMYAKTPQADIDAAIYRDTHYELERVLHLDYAKLLTQHGNILAWDGLTLSPWDGIPAVMGVVASLPRPRRHDARERYDWLLSFLHGAIDADDPIICSW